jgi:ATP-binding cassette subfamily B protein
MTVTSEERVANARWTRCARVVLAAAFRADPWRASAVLLLSIVAALTDTLFPFWLKLLVDSALQHDAARAMAVAGGIAATLGVSALAGISGFIMRIGLEERTSYRIDRDIIALTAGLPGVEHHERPLYLDQIELLRTGRTDVSMALGAAIENIAVLFRVGGTLVLLATVHPLLLLLAVFALPSLWTGGRAQRIVLRADEEVAERRRLMRHFFDLATSAAPAKELRIFGTGDMLLARHARSMSEVDAIASRARLKAAAYTAAGWIVFALGYVGAIALVVQRALSGRATPGDVLLALQLASQINSQVRSVVMLVSWMLRTMRAVSRYVWLVDHAKVRRAPSADAEIPHRIARGIDVRGVAFRYPGTETEVLRDVDLHIPAGSTVAIVGDNGAGKSTLVKLLCRFYDLTEGSIALDGTDIARFDIGEWRARMSAGFQDFARPELLARETVGIGDVVRIDDERAVSGALARASAADVVDVLPSRLETQLGKSFDDGVELSGGQWQKLALGRAMMREAPLLLVLDEPTAALDADTEHALFERYAGAARRVARDTGAITVFVSHRFSTVRMADLIVVVDDGRVAEAGSHEELVARGGLYAELYELQARAYR